MADQIGELGLDVSDIKSQLGVVIDQLGRLNAAVDATDKKVKGGLVGTLKDAAKVFGLAFGAQAIVRYIYNLRNLSNEIDQVRSKMGADSVGEGGASFIFARAGVSLDKFVVKAKIATAEAIQGARLAAEDAGNAISEVASLLTGGKYDGGTHEVRNQIQADRRADAIKQQLIRDEGVLAQARGSALNTQQEQISLMEEEIRLREKRIALVKSNRENFDNPQEIINNERAAVGALKAQVEAVNYARTQEAALATATAKAITLQVAGYSAASKEVEIRARFEKEIAQALRDQKTELAASLQLQRDIALNAIAVDEHNKTPAQRRDERRAARKFARDTRKAAQHEKDLEERYINSFYHPETITPGSELDRYRQRRNAQRAANGKAAQGNPLVQDSPLAASFYKQGEKYLAEISKNTQSMFQNK